jgi:hypothetical protein
MLLTMAPENLTVYLLRKDKSIADISDVVRECLGLPVIAEVDRLDAIDFGWSLSQERWPDDANLRVWCYPQPEGSEDLYGPKG